MEPQGGGLPDLQSEGLSCSMDKPLAAKHKAGKDKAKYSKNVGVRLAQPPLLQRPSTACSRLWDFRDGERTANKIRKPSFSRECHNNGQEETSDAQNGHLPVLPLSSPVNHERRHVRKKRAEPGAAVPKERQPRPMAPTFGKGKTRRSRESPMRPTTSQLKRDQLKSANLSIPRPLTTTFSSTTRNLPPTEVSAHIKQCRKYARSLLSLANRKNMREIIVSNGAIPAIAQLCKSGDRVTEEHCVKALRILMQDKSIREIAVKQGTIEALVEILNARKSTEGVELECVTCIYLATLLDHQELRVVKGGAIAALAAVAQRRAAFAIICAGALCNLSTAQTKFNRMEGIVQAVLDVLAAADCPQSVKICAQAICNLSCITGNPVKVIEDGVVRVLRHLTVESTEVSPATPGDDDVDSRRLRKSGERTQASPMHAGNISMQDLKHSLWRHGSKTILMKNEEVAKESREMMEVIAVALCNLAKTPEARVLMLEEGVLEALKSILERNEPRSKQMGATALALLSLDLHCQKEIMANEDILSLMQRLARDCGSYRNDESLPRSTKAESLCVGLDGGEDTNDLIVETGRMISLIYNNLISNESCSTYFVQEDMIENLISLALCADIVTAQYAICSLAAICARVGLHSVRRIVPVLIEAVDRSPGPYNNSESMLSSPAPSGDLYVSQNHQSKSQEPSSTISSSEGSGRKRAADDSMDRTADQMNIHELVAQALHSLTREERLLREVLLTLYALTATSDLVPEEDIAMECLETNQEKRGQARPTLEKFCSSGSMDETSINIADIENKFIRVLIRLAFCGSDTTKTLCAAAICNLARIDCSKEDPFLDLSEERIELDSVKDETESSVPHLSATRSSSARSLRASLSLTSNCVIGAEVIPSILRLIRYSSVVAVHKYAVALYHMVKQKEACEALIYHKGLFTLMRIAEHEDMASKRLAAGILQRLSIWKDLHSQLVVHGFVSALINASKVKDQATQQCCAVILYHLSAHGFLRHELTTQGAVKALLALSRLPNERIRRTVAASLCNFSSDPSLGPHLINEGAVTALLVIALATSYQEETKALCTRALFNLMSVHEMMPRLLEEGAAWGFSCLAQCSLKESQHLCAVALCNLACEPAVVSHFQSAGAVKAIALLAASPVVATQNVVVALIVNVLLVHGLKAKLLKSQLGILLRVQQLARAGDRTVQEAYCKVICLLSTKEESRKAIFRTSTIASLYASATSQSYEHRKECVIALHNLSYYEDSGSKVILAGGMPALIALTEEKYKDTEPETDSIGLVGDISSKSTEQPHLKVHSVRNQALLSSERGISQTVIEEEEEEEEEDDGDDERCVSNIECTGTKEHGKAEPARCPEIDLWTMRCLLNLSTIKANLARMACEGTVEAVAKLLLSYETDLVYCTLAVDILYNLTCAATQHQELIRRDIVRILQQLWQGFETFLHCASDDKSSTDSHFGAESTHEARDRMNHCRTMPTDLASTVNGLSTFTKVGTALSHSRLASPINRRESRMITDRSSTICLDRGQSLEQDQHHIEELRATIGLALCNLCCGKINSAKAVDQGAGEILVEFAALAKGEVQEKRVAAALRNLLTAPGNRVRLVEAGVIPALLLLSRGSSPDLWTECSLAIQAISSTPSLRVKIIEGDGLSVITGAVGKGTAGGPSRTSGGLASIGSHGDHAASGTNSSSLRRQGSREGYDASNDNASSTKETRQLIHRLSGLRLLEDMSKLPNTGGETGTGNSQGRDGSGAQGALRRVQTAEMADDKARQQSDQEASSVNFDDGVWNSPLIAMLEMESWESGSHHANVPVRSTCEFESEILSRGKLREDQMPIVTPSPTKIDWYTLDGTVEVANSEEEDELGLEQTERETADKVVEACTARISENEIIKSIPTKLFSKVELQREYQSIFYVSDDSESNYSDDSD